MSVASQETRRRFLKFLAGSPLLACAGISALSIQQLLAQGQRDVLSWLVTSADEAVNVFDFESVAREKLTIAHFGYIATGTDDDETIRANRDGFKRYQLRARRLVDVRTINTKVELFGRQWDTPIILAPAGSQKAFHDEGEIAVARAAKSRNALQVLSTFATTSVEDVNEARGEPVWYQLYSIGGWKNALVMAKRAEAAGCPVLVFTVDLLAGSNREALRRARIMDQLSGTVCSDCHPSDPVLARKSKPMFDWLDMADVTPNSGLTWDFVDRLKDATSMKLVIKGIVTREDAELCVEHGVDGIVVSNHGGRAEASGRSTIECLPEIVAAVDGRIPVLIDSGFRRGTDIFKAMALGADAICIGRPYLWGLGAFGQTGVERVLDILRRELTIVMRQMGTTRIGDITRASIV